MRFIKTRPRRLWRWPALLAGWPPQRAGAGADPDRRLPLGHRAGAPSSATRSRRRSRCTSRSINAEGGVLGRKLQLVAYDDGGDAEKARTFAKRLLEQDKVDVIVGGSTTGDHDGGGAAGRAAPACRSSRWPARW